MMIIIIIKLYISSFFNLPDSFLYIRLYLFGFRLIYRLELSDKQKRQSLSLIHISVLNLLYIYDKADRASISEKEIEQLLKQNGLK